MKLHIISGQYGGDDWNEDDSFEPEMDYQMGSSSGEMSFSSNYTTISDFLNEHKLEIEEFINDYE